MQLLTSCEALDEAQRSSGYAIPLARCRELLGDEASNLSDQELHRVREHAAAMAHVLLLAFLESR